jgi:hypothetical protein
MRPDNLRLYHASRTARQSAGYVRTTATSGPAWRRPAPALWRFVGWLALVVFLLGMLGGCAPVTSETDPMLAALLLCIGLVAGGVIANSWHAGRARRQRATLQQWRLRLAVLHEDHMRQREAWAKDLWLKGGPKQDRVVQAAQAVVDHMARMPLGGER